MLLVLLTIVGVTLPGGITYAWFSGSGSGSGSGSTGTLETVTIASDYAVPVTALLPGHSGGVALSLNNPNNFAVRLVGVVSAVSESRPIVVSNAPGCTVANSGVTFNTPSSLDVTIGALAVGQLVNLPDAVSMSAAAANACQGATFAIPVTITVRTP